ncbi:MAG: tol-pal system protein YbgF [Nitrospirota bacterium]|nr:MAG: tol-pal system protein YbgF [Nitrospirota bacterium]
MKSLHVFNHTFAVFLLMSLFGCATEPNLADLKKEVQTLNEQQGAFLKQEQQILERLDTIESQLDEHDFLVGELIKTEEEASLDTRNLLDKLERTSTHLRDQIDQTRSSTRQRDQDLSIRVKAIESRLDNLINERPLEEPKQVNTPNPKKEVEKETPKKPNPNPTDTPSLKENNSNGQLVEASDNQASAFRSAYKSYLNGRYARATVEFQQFVKQYPAGALTPQAYYYLGDAQYIQKQYKGATRALQHILTAFPDNKYVPPALLKLGLVMMETDQAPKAQEFWDEVIQKFPDSPEAEQAKIQIAKAQAAR